MVDAEGVQPDAGPGDPRGPAPTLHVGATSVGSRRACPRHHGVTALPPQGGPHRHRWSVVRRPTPHDPFPWRSAPSEAGQGQLAPRGLDAWQAPDRERLDDRPGVCPCRLDPWRVPFGGMARRLWRGRPRRGSRRDLVAPRPQRPRRCPSHAPRAATVAAAGSWSPWRTTTSAACSPRGWQPPACGRGAIWPVLRRRWTSFATTARLTPHRAARGWCEPQCSSYARRLVSRRSRAEGFRALIR